MIRLTAYCVYSSVRGSANSTENYRTVADMLRQHTPIRKQQSSDLYPVPPKCHSCAGYKSHSGPTFRWFWRTPLVYPGLFRVRMKIVITKSLSWCLEPQNCLLLQNVQKKKYSATEQIEYHGSFCWLFSCSQWLLLVPTTG